MDIILFVFPIPQLALVFTYVLIKILIVNPSLIFKFIIYERDIRPKDFFNLKQLTNSGREYGEGYDRDPGTLVEAISSGYDDGAIVLAIMCILFYPLGVILLTVFALLNLITALSFLLSPFLILKRMLFDSKSSFMNKIFLKKKIKKEF